MTKKVTLFISQNSIFSSGNMKCELGNFLSSSNISPDGVLMCFSVAQLSVFSKHNTLRPNKANVLWRFGFVFLQWGVESTEVHWPYLFKLSPNSPFKSIGIVQQLPRQPYLNMDPIN